ncbi:hypothetical protein A3A67_00065 [Candidatus Peribacteria bacterium RIFCSPLOWO2_01_FULL_51_18]|nr:MAG: hypothetical protein A3C52_00200 [Candidatus Peribacteria bacterium RIFCSPHIGHO2_02_FULL_51_15]OGJ65292.1 MAG: hypothetical protein A3A67_00065 [Candidatus Peribacteria bacterium RIFCSPLOWO2_01_FULL_51_18]OGJ69171.1 MAG: hypothetical protein A3J34_02525 [Candidatus Peribacteria bacterium RIFCSPLOWO2_02_FULL_51_10]
MFVVTLPKSAEKNPLAFAQKAKKAGADILEIRGDLTPETAPFSSPIPLLLTPRGVDFRKFSKLKIGYLDLEIGEAIPSGLKKSVKIIRSFHDYKKTPPETVLKSVAEKLHAENPWAIKIAVKMNDYRDLKLIEDFRRTIPPRIRAIVLGMGQPANLNRMLSPLRDELSYTFMKEGEAAAEGQVPLKLCQAVKHCLKPRLYGLLGSPDVRSFSPVIHNALFEYYGIDALYFLALTPDLGDAWENLKALGIEGFSVTSPWKRGIVKLLDRTEKNDISVNTAVKKNKEWIGYPRDAQGLINGYPFLKNAINAVILGAGGVVPEAVKALKLSGVKDIKILGRDKTKTSRLAKSLKVKGGQLDELAGLNPDLLVCAITADINLHLKKAKKGAYAIDLRYKYRTKFLDNAEKAGYRVYDGLPMLIHQALAQFELFAGIKPVKKDIRFLEKILHPKLLG